MKILIDTHIFLWYVTNSDKLNEPSKNLINDRNNLIYLSQASIWEIAIKNSLGKLKFSLPFREFIEEQIVINDFNYLNFNLLHFEQIIKLPFHHRDPFDRIIIAQSIIENIPIITYDNIFNCYDIQLLGLTNNETFKQK